MDERIERSRERLHDTGERIAFLVGNGINNFRAKPDENSWKGLLIELGVTYSELERGFLEIVLRDSSVTYPEFFDLIQLLSETRVDPEDVKRLKAKIASRFDSWEPKDHHRLFIRAARSLDLPVLTTNYDYLIESADDETVRFVRGRNRDGSMKPLLAPEAEHDPEFPWHAYYSYREVRSAPDEFAVRHIHGMGAYPESIRLSLSDYMGAVDRARRWLLEEPGSPFNDRERLSRWRGNNSWLDIFFHRPVFIFGLSLESQEVGIRWLLIEREKYYRKFPELRRSGWYAAVERLDDLPGGKRLFFENLGFEVLIFSRPEELYEEYWERLT